jgi:hypothetical protein
MLGALIVAGIFASCGSLFLAFFAKAGPPSKPALATAIEIGG